MLDIEGGEKQAGAESQAECEQTKTVGRDLPGRRKPYHSISATRREGDGEIDQRVATAASGMSRRGK